MKRFVFAALLVLCAASSASAVSFGFRAYSSATAVTCGYAVGTSRPDTSFSPTSIVSVSLGTKGVGTVELVNGNDYSFKCGKTSDGAAQVVKFFLGTEGTNIFPASSFLLSHR